MPTPPRSTWVSRLNLNWLGLLPFFLFAFAFLCAPTFYLLRGSFQDTLGNFTLGNYPRLTQDFVLQAYWRSLRISFVTAFWGGIFGFLLAYAVVMGELPSRIRTTLLTFSGVASNFAGVPLAFAFIATLGRTGMVTGWVRDSLGINLYQEGFSLYSFEGLSLTYLYFQFPLMVLIIAPALEGLKKEWREAAENLGASAWQYWWHIALPILAPSILGTMILLFGNAFGAHATAFALTGGTYNLVTILIGAQIRGDVLRDPGLGYALAMGMVIIMAISIAAYTWLQRKTEQWLS